MMTLENFNKKLENLAERLNEVSKNIEQWDYDETVTNKESCKVAIITEPLTVIEYLLDNIEAMF